MKRKKLLGSFTVEATFVVPITIFIIIALLFATISLYDTAVIQSQTDAIVFQASTIKRQPCNIITGEIDYPAIKNKGLLYSFSENEEVEQQFIEVEVKEQIEQKSLFTKVLVIQALLENRTSRIQVLTNSTYNYMPVLQIFNPGQGDEVICTENYTPTEFIRAANVAMETGSDIKGADRMKELIRNIIEAIE